MTTTLNSARFGTVEIPDDQIIEFPLGLIGIESHRYALLSDGEDSPFAWLHSLDDPSFAIPVISPWPQFADYGVEISDEHADDIGISGADQTAVYVTVRATADPADCTVNLRAPILIARHRGFQVINEVDDAPVRAPLFQQAEPGATSNPASAA